MKEEVRIFLLSGLLEEYALGLTSPEQNVEVERYLENHLEVRQAYEKVQEEIEGYAKSIAVDPPGDIRSKVFQTTGNSSESGSKPWRWAWAAAVAILTVSLFSVYQYLEEVRLEKTQLQAALLSLQEDCEMVKQQSARMAFIGHSQTHSWMLNGNDKAPDIKLMAFWNGEAKEGHLMVQNLPDAPEGHCYQLWVDVEGEMLPVAIINDHQEWVPLEYRENIESINMTIEEDGGSDHPNVTQLVASVQVSII